MNLAKVRKFVRDSGQIQRIQIGRSCNQASCGTRTPVEVIPGDSPPKLVGLPYLKTTFKKPGFSKTLYTPSTLSVIVGKDWLGD